MTADRTVPPMPLWTTLAQLEREHNRIREQRAADMPEPRRMPEAWAAHLAKVLRVESE